MENNNVRLSERKFAQYKKNGENMESEAKKIFTVKLGRKEEFYITYCNYMAWIYDLKYANDIKLMAEFCSLSEFDTGVVRMTKGTRKDTMEKLNMSSADISKSIRRLREKSIITGDDGDFTLNPALFWKGDADKRVQMLRDRGLSLTFGFRLEGNED